MCCFKMKICGKEQQITFSFLFYCVWNQYCLSNLALRYSDSQ